MKTIEISPNNLFVIIRSSGINADILVSNKKNLGAMVASMIYGAKAGSKEYKINVIDIRKELVKTYKLNVAKSYNDRVSISTKSTLYAAFKEVIMFNQHNDLNVLINTYKFKPFTLTVFKRTNSPESFIIKTNSVDMTKKFINSHTDFEAFISFNITSSEEMAKYAIYNRYMGSEEPGLGYYAIDEKTYKHIIKTKQ